MRSFHKTGHPAPEYRRLQGDSVLGLTIHFYLPECINIAVSHTALTSAEWLVKIVMAVLYPEFEWREAVPGRWERGVDEIEEFYFTIRKLYAGSGRMKIVETSASALDWATSNPPAPALPTLFLVKSRHDKDSDSLHRSVVFRSPHEVIDGIGTLQLLHNLFELAAEAYSQGVSYDRPEFGREHSRLSPPFRAAASIPRELTVEQNERWYQMLERNKSLRQDLDLSILPYKRGPTLPGIHRRVAIQLSLERTGQIMAACKSLGATVTHVYHAAITMALRDLQARSSQSRNVRYLGYTLINHRKSCHWPDGPTQHPVSAVHSSSGVGFVVDLKVPANGGDTKALDPRKEFIEALAVTKDYYHSIRDDPDSLAWAPKLFGLGIPKLPAGVLEGRLTDVPAPDPNPSVTLSSMGRIDDQISHQHGSFKLDNPWITGEELRTALGTFLGTWKGQLTFSAAYNDAWHSESKVMEFLKACNEIVFEGLGLES